MWEYSYIGRAASTTSPLQQPPPPFNMHALALSSRYYYYYSAHTVRVKVIAIRAAAACMPSWEIDGKFQSIFTSGAS
jgi:hypothetical protein